MIQIHSKPYFLGKIKEKKIMSSTAVVNVLFFFVFFYLGFTALSRIFHLYQVDRSSKVGENQRTQRKTT